MVRDANINLKEAIKKDISKEIKSLCVNDYIDGYNSLSAYVEWSQEVYFSMASEVTEKRSEVRLQSESATRSQALARLNARYPAAYKEHLDDILHASYTFSLSMGAVTAYYACDESSGNWGKKADMRLASTFYDEFFLPRFFDTIFAVYTEGRSEDELSGLVTREQIEAVGEWLEQYQSR